MPTPVTSEGHQISPQQPAHGCSHMPAGPSPGGAREARVSFSTALPLHISNLLDERTQCSLLASPTGLRVQPESLHHTSCSSRGSGVHAEAPPGERGS